MRAEKFTRLSIDVPKELHKVMKFHIVANHLNIKNYVVSLIKNDLSEEMEDYLLGQMALESMKEGFIGVEKSEKLLNKLLKGSNKKISHQKKPTKNEKVRSN